MIKARRRKEWLRKLIIYSGLVLFALFVLFPFAIMVISSLKHKEETIGGFTWWPKMGLTLRGYANAFKKVASSTSKVCAELLKSLLSSHSCKENAVAMANNFIRNKQNECSSSVDILEIDLINGKAGLIKSGAAPSFVKRDGKVFRLFSKTAPIGIMKEPDSETLDFCLKEGVIVLMVSDGICQGEEDSGWLADMLSVASAEELSSLPKRIADRSKERTHRKDDRTVAICTLRSAVD